MRVNNRRINNRSFAFSPEELAAILGAIEEGTQRAIEIFNADPANVTLTDDQRADAVPLLAEGVAAGVHDAAYRLITGDLPIQ